MNKILVADDGRLVEGEKLDLAEKVFKLKHANDHWGVIDLLVKIWAKNAPEEVKAHKVQIDDYKEMLDDPKFGQTKNGKDFERRFTLTFPDRLLLLIRTVYKADELDLDKEFFKDFAKRYPFFRVAEKD